MNLLHESTRSLIEDFENLEREIQKELDREEINASLSEFPKEYTARLERIRGYLASLFQSLNTRLVSLSQKTEGYSPDNVSGRDKIKDEINEIQNLIGELQIVWGRLETLIVLVEAKMPATSTSSGFISKLKDWGAIIANWLKGIGKALWNMLSRLLTPKEWKLTGKVGTGPFNLADVGVEITFGT